jgi:hypothetical protein
MSRDEQVCTDFMHPGQKSSTTVGARFLDEQMQPQLAKRFDNLFQMGFVVSNFV